MQHQDIVTPVNPDIFEQLLRDTNFEEDKISKLVTGFRQRFSLEYTGNLKRKHTLENLPFTVGDPTDMWNKIMKEVKAGRYTGPYTKEDLPFENYVQSPIGLVPKSGNKTRLIFHLSFDFTKEDEEKSINHHTPKDHCSVKYNDLDCAVRTCLHILAQTQSYQLLFFGKTDLVSAFRILPILPIHHEGQAPSY